MAPSTIASLLESLLLHERESEWIEFKRNFHSPDEIGQTLSALSNTASIYGHREGYLVFGIEDHTKAVVGTSFKPGATKKGNEELENWLIQRLNPRIDFRVYEFPYQDKHLVLFVIPAAQDQPVTFLHEAWIRVGSVTRKLRDFPSKERKIWVKSMETLFEQEIAMENVDETEITQLLDTQSYFELLHIPYPSTRKAVIDKLIADKLVIHEGRYAITNLGGLLFAKQLQDFPSLGRKAVRIIEYKGRDVAKPRRDLVEQAGYAAGFGKLISYIHSLLPINEVIEKALRRSAPIYPVDAIRELVANALVHQNLREKGGPVVEIYSNRIIIVNPGVPLISTARFIDEYQSRNDVLADMMRRLGMCEERGSGIDKVVKLSEVHQLPAPDFQIQERHTKAVIYAPLEIGEMDRQDKVRACYQHCCLKYVSNEKMTNQTLRERLHITKANAAMVSRIIKDTLSEGLIKFDDPHNVSRKYSRYIPVWA